MESVKRKGFLASHIKALRPKQWTKNLVIYAAPLFAFQLTLSTLINATIALALFCSLSSCFYLVNDILDVESDRRHPVKRYRPIASGAVTVPVAIAMAVVLSIGSLSIGTLLSPYLGIVLASYAVLQIAYNLQLKHKVILDIIAIATGFILRACAGAAAANVGVSPWFLLCVAMLALFLGIEKRKAELRVSEIKGSKSRKVLYRYTHVLLARMESSVTTGAIMCYALWSSGSAVHGASTPWMMLSLPFVIYGIFRYQLLSDPDEALKRQERSNKDNSTERPEEVLLTDRPIALTVIAWGITVFTIMTLNVQGVL
ncbi:MAG: decaprenyl-phosphate phosphoribosyltransferase [Elainellaceae cyanobacterium]